MVDLIKSFKKDPLKKADEELCDWSDLLLGNQFLKLYFNKLGISNSLNVDRIVKLEDFKTYESLEKLQFVIVRSKFNKKNIEIGKNGEQIYNHSRVDFAKHEKIFFENNFLFFVSFFFKIIIYQILSLLK